MNPGLSDSKIGALLVNSGASPGNSNESDVGSDGGRDNGAQCIMDGSNV